MTAISNAFFEKKKMLTLPWLSILIQDHEFSEIEELEDMSEIDEYLEGKKKFPAAETRDNSVEKVLTPLKRYEDMCLNPDILPRRKRGTLWPLQRAEASFLWEQKYFSEHLRSCAVGKDFGNLMT